MAGDEGLEKQLRARIAEVTAGVKAYDVPVLCVRLGELAAKIEERGTPEISKLTRRRIIALFDGEPLCPEHDDIAFLEQLWPLAGLPSAYDSGFDQRSLREDIVQHTVRSDDWMNGELLEHVGLADCSKALLFRFLEAMVHPNAVPDDVQRRRLD
jgi:hypothetical protein